MPEKRQFRIASDGLRFAIEGGSLTREFFRPWRKYIYWGMAEPRHIDTFGGLFQFKAYETFEEALAAKARLEREASAHEWRPVE